MVEISRTIPQWRATERQLGGRHPAYLEAAQRVRGMIATRPTAPLDTPLTVRFTLEEAAVILARAPLSAWWMPAPSVSVLPSVEAAFAEAEAIIRAILRSLREGAQTERALGTI
ncbi:MAG: hypothetical protein M3Q03_02695 [Chloroflexota bacterium]|nr:hypothetical protein [Chloroflexota bacterium]